MSYRNSNSMPEIYIGEAIMAAISELGGSEGASLDGIEWYLTSALKEVPDREEIQSRINDAVYKKLLTKLPNGNYKIEDSAKREQKSCQDECDCAKTFQPLTNDEKIKETAGSKEVDPQEENSVVDNVFTSKSVNGEVKKKETSRRETNAQGANKAVDKVFATKTADKEAKIKETSSCEKEAQEPKNTVDKDFGLKMTDEEAKMKNTPKHEKGAQDAKNTIDKDFVSKTANGETEIKDTSRYEKDAQDPKNSVDKGFLSKFFNKEVKTKDTTRLDKDAQDANLNAADPSANKSIKRSTSDDDNVDDLYES